MLLYFSSQTYKYVLGVGNKLYLVTGKHYYQKDLQTATCHTMQRRQVEERAQQMSEMASKTLRGRFQ